jgi:hypothetical protein
MMSEQSPEKVNTSEAPAETFSLASILSEYKSEAFIRNERRYSKEELEKRADEIINEMKRSVEAEIAGEEAKEEPEPPEAPADGPETAPAEETEAQAPAPETEAPAPEKEDPSPEPPGEVPQAPIAEPAAEPEAPGPEEPPAEVAAPEEESPDKPEPIPIWVPREKRKPREPAPLLPVEEEEEPAPPEEAEAPPEEPAAGKGEAAPEEAPEENGEEETEAGEAPGPDEADAKADEAALRQRQRRAARAEQARRRKKQREEKTRRREEAREEARREKPEPTPEEALRLYASGIVSLRRRMTPAFALCAVMALLVLLSGRAAPESALGGNTAVILLAAMQLAVMLLGLDVLVRGVTDLASAHPSFESVVLLANVAAEVDAVLILAGRAEGLGLPYCAPAAVSLAFALWGSLCRRSAFRDTVKAMRLASVPTVVTAAPDLAEEGVVLNKKLGSSKGFLKKAVQPDLPERVYKKLSPPVLILLVILALAAAFLSGTGAVIHCLAALSCAAAALTATLAFARPFALTAKKLTGNGAALAGWSGAEDMSGAVGLVIRDLDVYPENTIILNGMKVLSGAHVEKVVAYTGSVILATGSGLRRVFGELMRQYAAPLYRVEDFDCGTEGGVSAFVGMEQVLVGTGAYMNLMGIRVPGSVDVGGAVYTAIDHELCGVFIVNYLPQELVQNALFRFESGKLRPVYAIRDFNISPAMLVQKFRLSEGSIVFLPPEDRYRLSVEPPEDPEPAALLSREGLWHYSEAARGGRRLWRNTRRALLMTLLGAALGVAIVFISCARGAFGSASPGKLLLAMLLWALATMLIADSAEGD